MSTAKEISGFYGSHHIPDTIYFYDGWYCVHGSKNVNHTSEELTDGVDVELIDDDDIFTWDEPIENLNELINAVEN